MSCQPFRDERPTKMGYTWIRNFLVDESGPTAVEYAMMLALVLVTLVTAINSVGNSASGVWTKDVNKIKSAITAAS